MKVSDSKSDHRDSAVARKLAALAHPVRLRLLRQMGSARTCCVKDMVEEVGLAQSTVSQHLKVLYKAGLVTCRSDRQRSCYHINGGAMDELVGVVGQFVDHCRGTRCPAGSGQQSDTRITEADAMAPLPDREDV